MSSKSSNKSFQPPSFSGYHCVGWIKSAHGIRGEIFVQLYAKKADWLDRLDQIHLLLPKTKDLACFQVTTARPHKEGLILVVEGVVDRNRAEEMVKSGAYIPEAWLESDDGEDIYLKQILGFELLNGEGVRLGEITGFATNGAQDLLRVTRDPQPEALVPFVEAFLRNIDFDKRQVHMELPEGLLTLEDE